MTIVMAGRRAKRWEGGEADLVLDIPNLLGGIPGPFGSMCLHLLSQRLKRSGQVVYADCACVPSTHPTRCTFVAYCQRQAPPASWLSFPCQVSIGVGPQIAWRPPTELELNVSARIPSSLNTRASSHGMMDLGREQGGGRGVRPSNLPSLWKLPLPFTHPPAHPTFSDVPLPKGAATSTATSSSATTAGTSRTCTSRVPGPLPPHAPRVAHGVMGGYSNPPNYPNIAANPSPRTKLPPN